MTKNKDKLLFECKTVEEVKALYINRNTYYRRKWHETLASKIRQNNITIKNIANEDTNNYANSLGKSITLRLQAIKNRYKQIKDNLEIIAYTFKEATVKKNKLNRRIFERVLQILESIEIDVEQTKKEYLNLVGESENTAEYLLEELNIFINEIVQIKKEYIEIKHILNNNFPSEEFNLKDKQDVYDRNELLNKRLSLLKRQMLSRHKILSKTTAKSKGKGNRYNLIPSKK